MQTDRQTEIREGYCVKCDQKWSADGLKKFSADGLSPCCGAQIVPSVMQTDRQTEIREEYCVKCDQKWSADGLKKFSADGLSPCCGAQIASLVQVQKETSPAFGVGLLLLVLLFFGWSILKGGAIILEGGAITVASDPKAKYWMLSNRAIGQGYRVITTQRIGPSGESFAVRLAKCGTYPRFAYIGDSDYLSSARSQAEDALNEGTRNIRLGPLTSGSISDTIVQAACAR